MNFLSQIDWQNHDGVNLSMINDFVRNQFYDRVLSRYVQGQQCTDIGFGTGLLSMLALRHGAKHIRAFESDSHRYQLGQEVIHRLGLQDRITLINERYNHSDYEPTPVTFSEIVNGNLWQEGLWNSMPVAPGQIFLPGTYFLELWAIAIPERFAQGLCRPVWPNTFNPAVDIDPEFVSVINQLRGIVELPEDKLPKGLVRFEKQQETDWGWIPHMRAVQYGSVIAGYASSQWEPDRTSFDVEVDTSPWRDCCVLIVPRFGMRQDSDQLYLDTGHWGPGEDPILLVCPQQSLTVSHSVIDGRITYKVN